MTPKQATLNANQRAQEGSLQNWLFDTQNGIIGQRKISAKQLVNHQYGFGNIAPDKLNRGSQSMMNKTTGLAGSGKFQQQLFMKQKEVEAQMIENHLRRLQNEELRLKKQIKIA